MNGMAANGHRVGDDARLEGEISFAGPAQVDGHVIGGIRSSETLVVGDTGRVEGQVAGASVEIEGLVQGEVVATDRLVIRARGRVFGELRTPSLVIEDGAIFEGSCDMESEATATADELPVPTSIRADAADESS